MLALFMRDLRLGLRAGGSALTGVLFFLAVIATIPFGLSLIHISEPTRPY